MTADNGPLSAMGDAWQPMAADLRVLVITDRHIMTATHGTVEAALRAAFPHDAASARQRRGQVWLLVRDKDASINERVELLALAGATVPKDVAILQSGWPPLHNVLPLAGCHFPESQSLASASSGFARSHRNLVIGCSRHHADDVGQAASQGAHYIQLGPVWDTPAKRLLGQPIGLVEISRARQQLSDMASFARLVAVGGVGSAARAAQAVAAGADAVACIAAVWRSKEPARVIEALRFAVCNPHCAI